MQINSSVARFQTRVISFDGMVSTYNSTKLFAAYVEKLKMVKLCWGFNDTLQSSKQMHLAVG